MKLKKTFIFVSLLGLLFGITILAISFLRIPSRGVKGIKRIKAQETGEKIIKEVDYIFPYPGILPDHPLYWLKMIRDRVQLIVFTPPAKKTSRLLHYADKRAAATLQLLKKGKIQLALTTFTKAEKYLERAFLHVHDIKNTTTKDVLKKALLKHKEVLESFEDNMSKDLYMRIESKHQRMENISKDW
jgi:hypothetical protein